MKKLSVTFITVFMFQLLLYPLTAFAQTLVANDFTKSTPRDTTLSFSANDFIGSANPPSGKSLVSIRFDQVTNPTAGILKLNGSVVGKGNTVSVGDLNGLTLYPQPDMKEKQFLPGRQTMGGHSRLIPVLLS